MDDTKPDSEFRTKLTKADLDEASLDRELVFHYSREHRLAKASPAVRAFNEPGPRKRRSVLGSLTSTRSHMMLFITIIVVSLVASFVTARKRDGNGVTLGGNTVSASAERIDGAAYLTIKKTFKAQAQDRAYTGAVDVVISPAVSTAKDAPALESLPIAAHRLFFTAKSQEEYGISIPFDAPTLVVIMQTQEDHHAVFRVKPK
ncbi:MAG: hypothetical protein LBG73_08510 [Spirochaetaceae bacterium]|jgi:hypothetical protein|nr:hypothetical protein [Spirochaetaceae bacterium]